MVDAGHSLLRDKCIDLLSSGQMADGPLRFWEYAGNGY